ncbi:MAG: hypothetical protein KIS79_05405 [Burkholderiales bacterium]|nr:hypothetical protein [Burkholderiales bacterium]
MHTATWSKWVGRKALIAVALGGLVVPLLAVAQQKHKFSSERSADTSEYTQQLRIDVDDVPGHQIRAYELKAVYPDDSVKFLDTPIKEEYNRAFSDYINTNGRHFGYCSYVLKNGDKVHCRIDGTTQATVNPDGSKNITFSGVTTLTGGTGKFQGIRGTLRYSGFYDPVANRSGDKTDGEYWIEE